MSTTGDRIEDEKPIADLQEQQRPEREEGEDPERVAREGTPLDSGEADPADVVEQLDEVPLDDDEPALEDAGLAEPGPGGVGVDAPE